jgi:hypothetical protein
MVFFLLIPSKTQDIEIKLRRRIGGILPKPLGMVERAIDKPANTDS